MRLFEAVVSKSDNNALKMAYYGAYYTLFQEEIKKKALTMNSNPNDSTFVEAWNYPNVVQFDQRVTRWSRSLWK